MNDALMEEDKTLLSYGLSYHSHITLCYNNPNIEIVVKVLEKEEPVLIDCNKTIQDLISVVYNVGAFVRHRTTRMRWGMLRNPLSTSIFRT